MPNRLIFHFRNFDGSHLCTLTAALVCVHSFAVNEPWRFTLCFVFRDGAINSAVHQSWGSLKAVNERNAGRRLIFSLDSFRTRIDRSASIHDTAPICRSWKARATIMQPSHTREVRKRQKSIREPIYSRAVSSSAALWAYFLHIIEFLGKSSTLRDLFEAFCSESWVIKLLKLKPKSNFQCFWVEFCRAHKFESQPFLTFQKR